MLDIRKLKELVRLMVANDLTELDLRDSEEQVTLRRQSVNETPHVVAAPAATAAPAPAPAPVAALSPAPAAVPTPVTQTAGAEVVVEDGLLAIESPMVGTFYSAPNPDSAPFVSVGDRVEIDTTVCLVEAMKNFLEIKAECSGTIDKVLVNNADSVEFGQPLFAVRPT